MAKALEGIRVVQLATFVAAAAAGRYLADHGADVIVVETAKGDPLRYTQGRRDARRICWKTPPGNT